jgi:hypothetical protein
MSTSAHGVCDRSAEDAYSSVAPDPTYGMIIEVRISPAFTADCSIKLTWTHWFCLQIIPLPDLDTLTLIAICSVQLFWTYWM